MQDDPIFVRDGNVYTSAGVTAGIDLALALVEEDLGASAALDVARALVLFVRRPGGQAQFSSGLAGQAASRPGIRELQGWIVDNLAADLSVAALAERAFMSPRNFARVFTAEVGLTPAAYVEGLRLERARMLLETTDQQLEEIAQQCGFGTVETLRRTFGRRLRVSPSEYRDRFATVIPIRRRAADMNIAIPIFDRLTALDAVGPYEVLSRLPGATVHFIAADARAEADRDRDAGADRGPGARRPAATPT